MANRNPKHKRGKNEPITLDKNQTTELIQTFLNRAGSIYGARSTWLGDQISARQMRLGLLADKDWPWPGAANVNIPIVESFIRSKSAEFAEVNEVIPLALFEPQTERMYLDKAKQWERYYEWKIETGIDGRRRLRLLVDRMLERGCFLKISYERIYEWHETTLDLEKDVSPFDLAVFGAMGMEELVEELAVHYRVDPDDEKQREELREAVRQFKAGKKRITFKRKVKVKDSPVWTVRKPEDVLRQPNAPEDIQQHRFFVDRFWQSKGSIRRKVREGMYAKVVLDDLDAAPDRVRYDEGQEGQIEREERFDDGINEASTDLPTGGEDADIETWEVYAYYSPDPEKTPERKAVFTMFPAFNGGHFARAFYLDRVKWPWKEFNYYNPDGTSYGGRGLPWILRDLQSEINSLHNMNLDALQISYLPIGQYDPNMLDVAHPGPMQIVPGLMIPGRANSVNFLKPQTAQFEIMQEENVLLGYAEQLVGRIQSAVKKRGSETEARTATEANIIQSLGSQVSGMDISAFQDRMKDVHYLTMVEIVENMPEEEEFRYSKNGVPMFDRVQRQDAEDLLFDIVPHGSMANMNKQQQAAKWQQRFVVAQGLAQMGVMVDFRELGVSYYSADGVQDVERILPEPPQGGMLGPTQGAPQAIAGGGQPSGIPAMAQRR